MKGGQSNRGFTIIEVMIFLAISGFLLVGIMAGTSASISRQRYQSAVQELSEFLRTQYSAVVNAQIQFRAVDDQAYCFSQLFDQIDLSGGAAKWASPTGIDAHALDAISDTRGRTDCTLYGRMVVFGEDSTGNAGQIVTSYDVLGKDYYGLTSETREDIETQGVLNPVLAALQEVGASPFVIRPFDSGNCSLVANSSRVFTIPWSASAEESTTHNILEATLLIVRSPIDGSIHTFVHSDAIPIGDINGRNLITGLADSPTSCADSTFASIGLLANRDNLDTIFVVNDEATERRYAPAFVEICVGSNDVFAYGENRRMIRIQRNGRNSSAVELKDMDQLRPIDDPVGPAGAPWCAQ